MVELQIIKHKDILSRDLLRAVDIKSSAWPYPKESQIKWISDNMQSGDMHVFLTEDGEDRAYMTLSPVTGVLNGNQTVFMGVGCVCSKEQGKGYGRVLMREVNHFLTQNVSRGLLFCRQRVVDFYRKNGWQAVSPDRIKSSIIEDGVFLMVFNCPDVDSLVYYDRSF